MKEERIATPTQARIEIPGSGLAIRTFTIVPISEPAIEALDNFGTTLNDAALQDRLESEGMTVRIIEAVDVPAIAALFGVAKEERFDWHGQILKWRDVKQRKMPNSGMLVTAGGIHHHVDRGYLTLLARAWQIRMEQDDQLYLQLLPVWHVPVEQGMIPGKNAPPSESRVFSELMIECLLEDDQALLVVTQMESSKVVTGPLDDGAVAVRLGEAIMGGSNSEPRITFLVFEAHIGSISDN